MHGVQIEVVINRLKFKMPNVHMHCVYELSKQMNENSNKSSGLMLHVIAFHVIIRISHNTIQF